MSAPHLTADLIRRFEKAERENLRLRIELVGARAVIESHRTRKDQR